MSIVPHRTSTCLLLVLFSLFCLLGLTACGSEEISPNNPTVNQNIPAASSPWASLEEFFTKKETEKLEELKKSMNETIDESLGVGGEIDVRVQGNELAYVFKFGPAVDTTGLRESLDTALNYMEAVFVDVANTLKMSTQLEKILVTVKYVDGSGNIITSRTFQSNDDLIATTPPQNQDQLAPVQNGMEAGLSVPS